MSEKVDLNKLASSFIQPVSWMKAFGVGSKIVILLLIGWITWTSLIQPHTKWRVASTTQHQTAETIENVTNNFPEEQGFIDLKLWIFRFKLW